MTINVRTLSRYALTLLAVPALPVLAATSYSFTGSTVNGPKYDRPGSTNPGSQDVRYSVQSFQVAADGVCRIISTQSFDGFLYLYRGSFDPADPWTNLVTSNDDAATYQYSSQIEEVQVAGGEPYTLVTTGYVQDQTGEFSNLIQCTSQVSTAGPACASSVDELDVTCLNRGRFVVSVTRHVGGGLVAANVVPQGTDDSAIFWFFNPTKWELFVKVIDGCAVNNHYWVFASALTNTEFELRVTDTQAGQSRSYSNDQGTEFPNALDTSAFPCN